MNLSVGTLFLIVGPSGVGKDTLIDGAKAALKDEKNFVFPTRYITRSIDAGGENHFPINQEEFEAKKNAGAFALSWEAHGLQYGISSEIIDEIKNGNTIVVNVSRSAIDEARANFPKVRIINISAPQDLLRARLLERGRENFDDIEQRLTRASAYKIAGDDVSELCNDMDRASAIEKFVNLLGRLAIGSV
ncbi:MAG: phnN [Hyphomonadaceae bacterium]|nr:MAG: phnN [Hyphomonadaceae bacterium]KAF0183634.1 MAG: phnN [Hyphomonadaceae bacterium]